MARLTLDDVRRVAVLAALEVDETEANSMCAKLDSILEYMADLDRLDVEGVQPTFHPVQQRDGLRADEVLPSTAREEVLAAAPDSEAGGFAVPKVLDGES